jgi:CBS domain-containing protein
MGGMMLHYNAIEIFTSEQARIGGQPAVDAVLEYIRGLKIAARCIVTRGIAGCYENGEVVTGRIEVLSFNMPVRIYIVLPAAETERVTDGLTSRIEDGIVVLHNLNVLRHNVVNAFFPRHLLVRDVMTPDPKYVMEKSPLRQAAELLLSSIFTGVPVVDEKKRLLGIITQGDLIHRGGMPLRLGLLSQTDRDHIENVLAALASKSASQAMTAPAVTIGAEEPLTRAVDRMLDRGVKRLPVVDASGRLTGILSRSDIFRAVMREAPDWGDFQAQKIEVGQLKKAGDILRRDTQTVTPDTPIDKVIEIIDQNDLQRVVVVDGEGKLLGLISDGDLLGYFKEEPAGIRRLLSKIAHPRKRDACGENLKKCLITTTAGMVMKPDPVTVREETSIEAAIRLMIDQRLKRLPVVDEAGRFRGMISRDSLLRTGFGGTH